jgi:hypothetical protein
MGVDLFFEVPYSPQPDIFIYNCVNVPLHISLTGGFMPRPVVNCDWMGTLANFLGQGWRLVEIFLDNSMVRSVSW